MTAPSAGRTPRSTGHDVDVVVVGGGPVGLAAAIEARGAGLGVVVVEPRTGAIDKACGEGLMPGTLAALHRLGVDPSGYPLTGITYRSPTRSVTHGFRSGPGRGVRRTTLQAALRARADEVGAGHLTARVDSIEVDPSGTGVTVAGVHARWLLGCDGLHSTVRRLTGLAAPASRGGARRFGVRRHFHLAPWTDTVEVHWGRSAEAYVTPVADDLVGVAILGPPGTSFDEALAGFPALAARLAAAPADPPRGAGPLLQRTVARTRGPVRLVGDASGYVDALTGEGLRVGFAQARAAVATLGDDDGYERAWTEVTRDYRLLTSGLVRWATSPLRPALVPAAAVVPGVFAAAVERLSR